MTLGIDLLHYSEGMERDARKGRDYKRGDISAVAGYIKRKAGEESLLAEQPIGEGRVYFKVEAYGQDYSFYVGTHPGTWQPVAEAVDGRILSTPVAGGFVGAYVGMYASSNGQPSENVADFDWFEYVGLD